MVSHLKKRYVMLLAPAGGAFTLLFILHHTASPLLQKGIDVPPVVSALVFVTAAMTALALPIALRTLFAARATRQECMDAGRFLKFQCTLLGTAMVTPYLGVAALALGIQKFYASATLLMGLYAVYYYFPSRRRIDFDRRIFRIR